MNALVPLLSGLQRRQVATLWDKGLDSFEIAFRMNVDEARVVPVISAYVLTKKFRKSAPQ